MVRATNNDPILPDLTEEQEKKIALVRILIGDVPQSIYFPLLSDYDLYLILESVNWNVSRAVVMAARSAAFYLTQTVTRERTGDIEVMTSAAAEYRKVLDSLIGDTNFSLPEGLEPWVAGASKSDVISTLRNPDFNRNPLFQMSPCLNWWVGVEIEYGIRWRNQFGRR